MFSLFVNHHSVLKNAIHHSYQINFCAPALLAETIAPHNITMQRLPHSSYTLEYISNTWGVPLQVRLSATSPRASRALPARSGLSAAILHAHAVCVLSL
jgi:hypothetical protein